MHSHRVLFFFSSIILYYIFEDYFSILLPCSPHLCLSIAPCWRTVSKWFSPIFHLNSCVSTIKQSQALIWFMASDYWGFIYYVHYVQPVSMRSYAVTMIRISFVCSKLKFIFTSTSAYVLGPVKSPHHSHRMWLLSKKDLNLKRKRRTFTMLCHNFEMIIINSIVCMMK